jgi:PAS domain S-box-containing protein
MRKKIAAASEGEARQAQILQAQIEALELDNERLLKIAEQGLQQYLEAAEKLAQSHGKLERDVADLNLLVEEKNRALDEKNKELERNLVDKERVKNYLASILESLPVGVLVTDLDGGVTTVNRAGQGMIGADAHALVGENINTLMGTPLVPRAEPAAEPREPLTLVRRDGATLKLQVSVTPMGGEGRPATGYVVNVQDVTLLKKLEEHAERRNRFTVMGEMAANIAHEIRNPLGSIELFASLVRKGLEEGDEKQVLMNHISSAITSMNHIISNVLEYTKPRAVMLKEMDLHGLLRELVNYFLHVAKQNGVDLTLSLEAHTPWIRGDWELLKQVFHNLLLNAVQAMPDGGALTLGTRSLSAADPKVQGRFAQSGKDPPGARGIVEVTVKDTGSGLPREIQGKIFDPFFTTKPRGTGLGLAIVHNIVEAHQATIDVESRPEQGTTFVLMFPLVRG